MISINMKSQANKVKGQGVLSAHDEQVNLVKQELSENIKVFENKHGRYDITHYHTINLNYFLGIPFAKIRGTTVGYVHFLPETLEKSIQLPSALKKAFYWYVIQFYKRMDYLVTVNPYFIDRLAEYGIDRNKISYIPNFVSAEQFYPIANKAPLRARYHLSEDQFVVLCVGQLQLRKGVLDFIEIAKQQPDVLFLWAGDAVFGKISNGYAEIQRAKAEAPPNVVFCGLIEREKMNHLYNLADVMFLPSYEELFPMTILESMNCRIPILLRKLDIYRNILFDFYLSEADNQGFLHQINRLKSDPDYYQQACESSYRGHLFYHRDHVAAMWSDFYERISR